jgi:hypothetical protein
MLQKTENVIDHNGEQVFFSVSPCSWMYPNYGLQVQLSLAENAVNAESEFILDKAFDAMKKPMPELEAAAKGMAEKWLAENGAAILHERVATWRARASEFDAEMQKEAKREAAAQKRRDKSHKAKGFTHRVNAWIHPDQGDDFERIAYVVGKPEKADIAKILSSSTVKDDYVVTEL